MADPELSPEEIARVQARLSSRTGANGSPPSWFSKEEVAEMEATFGFAICRRFGIFALPADFRLSVVIPVYNEAQTIKEVVACVRAIGLPCEMIIVDDCSTDGTPAVLKHLEGADTIVITHAVNRGKGAALRTGFMRASGSIVIVQDADLEYDPHDFPRLIEPIVSGNADVVYGSRFLGKPQGTIRIWHARANRLLTAASNLRTKLHLTDMETCYKAFRRDVIQQIAPTLQEERFGIEPELTAKLARIPNTRVVEVPISYAARSYAEGKKIGWRDALRALWCILKY